MKTESCEVMMSMHKLMQTLREEMRGGRVTGHSLIYMLERLKGVEWLEDLTKELAGSGVYNQKEHKRWSRWELRKTPAYVANRRVHDKRREKKDREEMNDRYIVTLLRNRVGVKSKRFRKCDISEGLMELKREQVRAERKFEAFRPRNATGKFVKA